MSTAPPSASSMRWAAARSTLAETSAAAAEAATGLREALGPGPIDLALAFFTTPHVGGAQRIADALRAHLAPTCLAGVGARGIVTPREEIEQGIGLTVVAARLPGVDVRPFLLAPEIWREPPATIEAFRTCAPGAEGAELVLLAGDPFSLDVERLLGSFQSFAPGVRVVGGMASAGQRPGANVLFLNDWLASEGGFALALHGAVRADVIVSQGCEPIGPPLDVTHVEANVILTLDGQPALERAEQVLRDLPEPQRERLSQGLYVGRPARGDATGRGDYLVRNLLGADRDRGALAVADLIPLREKIRLHVRDAHTATEDLEMLLSPQSFDTPAAAAVVFECNGRGHMLYGSSGRDLATLRAALGATVPIAGMFCAGEIGPVGERNFLHGHTASIAILRPRG